MSKAKDEPKIHYNVDDANKDDFHAMTVCKGATDQSSYDKMLSDSRGKLAEKEAKLKKDGEERIYVRVSYPIPEDADGGATRDIYAYAIWVHYEAASPLMGDYCKERGDRNKSWGMS